MDNISTINYEVGNDGARWLAAARVYAEVYARSLDEADRQGHGVDARYSIAIGRAQEAVTSFWRAIGA